MDRKKVIEYIENLLWADRDKLKEFQQMLEQGISDDKLKEMLIELGKKEEENLSTGIDWNGVKEEMEENGGYIERDGEIYRQIFLGTVFNLTPSGKYYTFWACGNLELCPLCEGEGCDFCGNLGSREALLDQIFWEKLEHEAEEHGYYITSGEGDPCDVLIGQYVGDMGWEYCPREDCQYYEDDPYMEHCPYCPYFYKNREEKEKELSSQYEQGIDSYLMKCPNCGTMFEVSAKDVGLEPFDVECPDCGELVGSEFIDTVYTR